MSVHPCRALLADPQSDLKTQGALWPCLGGLWRPPREPTNVCFASAVVLLLQGCSASAWHFDESIAAVLYGSRTAILQSTRNQRSQEREGGWERENERMHEQMNWTLLNYLGWAVVVSLRSVMWFSVVMKKYRWHSVVTDLILILNTKTTKMSYTSPNHFSSDHLRALTNQVWPWWAMVADHRL